MKIYITVTELWCVQDQRGITQKLRKREQPFLYATHRLYLIHIPKISLTVTKLWRVQG